MNVSRVHDGERENSGEEDLRGSAALDRLRDIRWKNSGTGVVAQPKPGRRAPLVRRPYPEIVPDPGGQRNVPASPEFGNRLREIRRIEILGEDESQHEAEPDGHVRVRAEVEITSTANKS